MILIKCAFNEGFYLRLAQFSAERKVFLIENVLKFNLYAIISYLVLSPSVFPLVDWQTHTRHSFFAHSRLFIERICHVTYMYDICIVHNAYQLLAPIFFQLTAN